MHTILIMYLVVVGFGIYMLAMAIKMKKTHKMNAVILAEEDLKKCKDQKAMADEFAPKLILFSVIFIIVGVIGVIAESVLNIGYGAYVLISVFLIAFLLFVRDFRLAREKYCS